MTLTADELYMLAKGCLADETKTLPEEGLAPDLQQLSRFINELIRENRMLRIGNRQSEDYIRAKINQMLEVMGTIPLRAEELDEKSLIALDPLGIISQSFSQILEHSEKTKRKLILAKDEIQAIFESVGGGLLVLDENRKILSCNSKFREMFNSVEEDIVGQCCYNVVCNNENQPTRLCSFKKVMQTGLPAFMADWKNDNRHLRIIANPIKDQRGRIVRTVILYIDITELVAARKALAEEKERLAITLESIAEGVIAIDNEGRVTIINREAEKLTGWSIDEAIGQQICTIMVVEEEGGGRSCAEVFGDVLNNAGNSAKGDVGMVLIDRSSQRRSIYISAAPIHQHDHSIAGMIVVFRDITSEKRMKEELAKATRLESLGVFAGGIAHDFNNLLTGVLGNVSLAKTQVAEETEIYKLLNDTEKTSYRARSLTQQLLTFAKGGDPIKRLLSIRDLIVESAEFCLRGSNVRCSYDISEDIRPVEVDEGQIGQVLQNLVINAAQAMPDGGGLKIGADNIEVEVDDGLLLTSGSYVKVYIRDEGGGIAEKDLEKIFDPFYTTKPDGSGLGLATSYSIVSKHYGLITVESTPGVGSTFYVYLPASMKELRAVGEHSQREVSSDRVGRVLVMDDEELIRTVAESILHFAGYRVDLAADGNEAIDIYKKAKESGDPVDVVLMDLTVPGGMGGRAAMAELLAFDPEAKGVVSSGYANDPIMADYRDYGFCGVIPKPYVSWELNATVAAIIAEKNNPSRKV